MLPTMFRLSQTWITGALALTVALCPKSVLAAVQPAAVNALSITESVAADIALQRGAILQGQVVNSEGIGVPNEPVRLTNGKQHWQTQTNEHGCFQLTSLRGGTYQFQAAGQKQLLRAWSAGTAPPRARQGLLVTPPTDVFRGQRVVSPTTNNFFRVAKHHLTNPVVITGITLTAVAIPVAIHNSDDDPPATP